ncbi:5-oxoprolinase subunit PxpB [Flavicella sp.]|uniref:5-oxoprolinase subunit PxpB n=1 Tax=Flavicella sp. TaxID=2957742 RepID=UPI0026020EC9|nr:5-oxoprolinase subunit PxpB [Flavicella sp.]MDG1804390.1 5-oxoprolinase subunit PxpB [Flavicella sp.]MDG2281050.1 5-oxoprolinase subunit PxpB [Flavicella sp.]
MSFLLKEFGDSAVLLTFGDHISKEVHLQIVSFVQEFKKLEVIGVVAVIPAYTTITIQYDFLQISYHELEDLLFSIDYSLKEETHKNIIEIPVCYHDDFALDIKHLMEYTGLTKREIVALHTSGDYLVYMLGFTPGFFYLGGLDSRLFCPRKEGPRVKIDRGSVGIAGSQTGVYSVDSPGGWQLLGKTPFNLFDATSDKVFPIKQGDYIRFREISLEEFNAYKK